MLTMGPCLLEAYKAQINWAVEEYKKYIRVFKAKNEKKKIVGLKDWKLLV